MALEFSLDISTTFDLEHILHILSEELSLESNESSAYLVGSGVLVTAFSKGELGQSVIEEAFGFRPDIFVLFRIKPKEEFEKGRHTIVQTTMKLLEQISGDAVLLFSGEKIVLQRIGGQLLLNREWGNWNESLLFEVKLPYELRELPSPLL
jgi:hypothetical protein